MSLKKLHLMGLLSILVVVGCRFDGAGLGLDDAWRGPEDSSSPTWRDASQGADGSGERASRQEGGSGGPDATSGDAELVFDGHPQDDGHVIRDSHPPPDRSLPIDLQASHDVAPPPPDQAISVGKWYQVPKFPTKDCGGYCNDIGLTSVPSPEGARCMSGEVRPKSGVDQGILFTIWHCPNDDCSAQVGFMTTYQKIWWKFGKRLYFCYRQQQAKDWDVSDITVACFCK